MDGHAGRGTPRCVGRSLVGRTTTQRTKLRRTAMYMYLEVYPSCTLPTLLQSERYRIGTTSDPMAGRRSGGVCTDGLNIRTTRPVSLPPRSNPQRGESLMGVGKQGNVGPRRPPIHHPSLAPVRKRSTPRHPPSSSFSRSADETLRCPGAS